MDAVYVARITLNNETSLSEIEEIFQTEHFSKPNFYAKSTAPMLMLVSPYQDDQGREVRSFELTEYLVDCDLLPKEPEMQGPVTQEMVDAVYTHVKRYSPKLELYRVSAADLSPGEYLFFGQYSGFEERGPGPFVPCFLKFGLERGFVTGDSQHLFKQE